MTICVIANPEKLAAKKPVLDIISWAADHNVCIMFDQKLNHFLEGKHYDHVKETGGETEAVKSCDYVIAVGGDGTMLWAARRIGDTGKPLLGVNSGRMGFLANIQQEKVNTALHYLLAGEFTLDKRHLLEAMTANGKTFLAFNEFLFSKMGKASMVTLVAKFDGQFINKYWADGIIVSTPTGSTAYNLSSGGPIVMPETNVFTLTPINPHTLTTRPLVLPSDKIISIIVEPPGQEVLFSNDGEICEVGESLTTINIQRSGYTIDLVKLPGQDYFKTLRTKLMWGADFREQR
ncbi:MAG: NAD(+)/NADH kinase [Balneolales bacterium]